MSTPNRLRRADPLAIEIDIAPSQAHDFTASQARLGCCRFLAKMEQERDSPTSEMTFILGSANRANVMFVFALVTLNHFK